MSAPVRTHHLCLVVDVALDDAAAEELVERRAADLGVRYARIEWGWTNRTPDRYGIAERDQLEAHLRDAGPSAVYLVVRIDEFDTPEGVQL